MDKNKLRGNVELGNILFQVGYISLCFYYFYHISALKNIPFLFYSIIPYTLFYSCLGIKVFFIDTFTKKEKIFFSIFIFFNIVNYFICHFYPEPLVFSTLLLAGKNISIRQTIKNWLKIAIPFYLIIISLNITGKIIDYPYVKNGHTRKAMGFIYPTEFGIITYYIFLAYSFIKKKHGVAYFFTGLLIAIFLYLFPYAITGIIIVSITTILFIAFSNLKILKNEHLLNVISFSMPALCLISLLLGVNYNPDIPFYFQLNELLSNRILLEKKAFETLNLSLFGNNFKQMGVAQVEYYSQTKAPYFFLDSSYFYILYRYGIIALVLITIGYTKSALNASKKNIWKIPITILIISIACISEGYLTYIGINPFTVLLITSIYTDNIERNKLKEEIL